MSGRNIAVEMSEMLPDVRAKHSRRNVGNVARCQGKTSPGKCRHCCQMSGQNIASERQCCQMSERNIAAQMSEMLPDVRAKHPAALLEKFWRNSQYLTYHAFAKLNATKSLVK